MAVNTRGGFSDFFLEDMLPQIHHTVQEKFGTKQDKIQFVYNVAGSTNSIEQTTTVGPFPEAPQKAEGSSVDYFTATQGFDRTYTHLTYALGFQTTEEMVEDSKFGLVGKFAGGLGKSVFETRQISGANVFNNGFTAGATAGSDGVAFFATTHPLLGGGTAANTPTVGADLNITSLEDAITNLADTRDDENKHIALTPKILLINPALKFKAREILKSELKADTANNNMNSLNEEGLMIVEWDYLTDTGAWFVGVAPVDSELWWYERRSPRVQSDFDFDSGNGKTKSDTRYSNGFSEWRGWYGST